MGGQLWRSHALPVLRQMSTAKKEGMKLRTDRNKEDYPVILLALSDYKEAA